jgi:hypothetical protein
MVIHLYAFFRRELAGSVNDWKSLIFDIEHGCAFKNPAYSNEGWREKRECWRSELTDDLLERGISVLEEVGSASHYLDVRAGNGRIWLCWSNGEIIAHWLETSVRSPEAVPWLESHFVDLCKRIDTDFASIYSNNTMGPKHEIEFGWRTYLSGDYASHLRVDRSKLNSLQSVSAVEADGGYVFLEPHTLAQWPEYERAVRTEVRGVFGRQFFGAFEAANRLKVKRKGAGSPPPAYSIFDMYGPAREFISKVPGLVKEFEACSPAGGEPDLIRLAKFDAAISPSDPFFLNKKRIALAVMGMILLHRYGGDWAIQGLLRREPVIKTRDGVMEPWRFLEELDPDAEDANASLT